MWRATLKGILGHKLRLLLTALAVVGGVAFVSGTFVLTDTLNAVFDRLFAKAYEGFDVIVQGKAAFAAGDDFEENRGFFPESVLAAVRRVDGVEIAEGSVGGMAQLVDAKGEPVKRGGAPTLGTAWPANDRLSPLDIRKGRGPSGPREAVIDVSTAEQFGFDVGQQVRVSARTGVRPFTIVGTVGFGDADNLAGATLVAFDLRTAQRLFDHEGQLDSIAVAARGGVEPEDLARRINGVLPNGVEAVTTNDAQRDQAQQIQNGLSFFTIALLVFAGIALFVGAFLIYNTFSIIVAQRTREFALLRALGASGGQILRSVLLESAVTGVVASVVGIGAGVLVATGLKGLLSAFGVDLPGGDVVVKSRTILVGLLTGSAITMASAVLPARRASRTSPMAALREEGAEVEAVEMFRAVLGLPVAMVGMAVLLLGLDGVYNGPLLTGIGALVVFLGVAVLAPVIARPVARVIAWPLPRLFGVHGNLARENASRNPRRTAATAAALMIGLALVAFVSVFAASIKASASRALDEMLAADFIITPQRAGGPAPGLAPVVALEMRRRPELTSVTPLRISPWRPGGEPEGDVRSVSAADPRVLGDVADLGVVEGTLSRLGPREVFVRDQTATERKLRVGDELVMEFPRKEPVPFRVAGLFAERRLIGSSYLISLAAFNSLVEDPSDVVVFAKAAPTASLEQARQALAAIEERFPQIEVNDQAEFKAEQSGQVDQLVNLVYALLGLAILIALLGITNTLALSIFERTRELGLLRAVGMSRRRVRSMIRWEAVVVSVLGAALGLPIGVFFGWAMVRALADEGFGVFAVPIGRLVVFVVLAGLAGVLAAVLPARRAAKLDVLQAIATE